MRLVTTGYEERDNCLGGGLVKGSTNLLVEEGKCLGELFLISMLKKRVEKGDKGVVDCFSLSPEKMKKFCEKYDISLQKYADSIHFIDLTTKEKNKVINLEELDAFAPAYISFVSMIKAKHIFNVVLSLSEFTCRFGEENTYKHLKENLKIYESSKRTSVYLIKRNVNSGMYINRLKEIFNSVILLKQCSAYDRFLSVEKSPLRKSSTELIRYNIGKELEKKHGVL
jgi:KaiC/GvpD/RAD55 family RecA-like ATPase